MIYNVLGEIKLECLKPSNAPPFLPTHNKSDEGSTGNYKRLMKGMKILYFQLYILICVYLGVLHIHLYIATSTHQSQNGVNMYTLIPKRHQHDTSMSTRIQKITPMKPSHGERHGLLGSKRSPTIKFTMGLL